MRLVTAQLGRRPKIAFHVQVECVFGYPAVIANAPFANDKEPNPNIYYLTCPYLRRELAVSEDRGMITELEAAIGQDQRLLAELREDQQRHGSVWRGLAGRDWKPGGGPPGPRIAAASSDSSLKCLHAHMAWHLAAGGVIGRILEGRLGSIWCDDERCRKMMAPAENNGSLS